MADKPEIAKPEEATSKPSKDAKTVRITVNGRPERTVNGIKFTSTPTVYKPGSIKWSDEEWADAKNDGFLAIEELDADGKVLPKVKE